MADPRLVEERDGELYLAVHVLPGASRNEVRGLRGDALLVRVTAPPQDGRANAAVTRLLARALGLKRSGVRLVSGETARRKRFVVTGADIASLRTTLAALTK